MTVIGVDFKFCRISSYGQSATIAFTKLFGTCAFRAAEAGWEPPTSPSRTLCKASWPRTTQSLLRQWWWALRVYVRVYLGLLRLIVLQICDAIMVAAGLTWTEGAAYNLLKEKFTHFAQHHMWADAVLQMRNGLRVKP
jgi:hypothetical protein